MRTTLTIREDVAVELDGGRLLVATIDNIGEHLAKIEGEGYR